jgi:putative Mn2+ efflux pump MntP
MSTTTSQRELTKKFMPENFTRTGWVLFFLGAAAWIAGYLTDPVHSAFMNIVVFLFLVSLGIGALFLVALEYLTGAVWSVPMRRISEFISGLLIIVPFVALPLMFHLHDLFHWTHDEAVSTDAILRSKEAYLNIPFFIVRFIGVFLIWNIFYFFLTRHSEKQDTTKDQKYTTYNNRLAAVFIPFFAIGLTVVAVDWAMSLEPHWFSTIFGVYYFAGTALAAVAAVTFAVIYCNEKGLILPLRRDHYYSLGALLFVFTNFWAYIAFSQFLLIWYANLPEETFWFIYRWSGGWQYVSVVLIIVHFAVPYFALLSQDSKMDPKRLKMMSLWILFAHLLDLYWLVMPTYSKTVIFGWQEVAFPILAVGIVMVLLSYKVNRKNTVPVGDPKLQRGLNFYL